MADFFDAKAEASRDAVSAAKNYGLERYGVSASQFSQLFTNLVGAESSWDPNAVAHNKDGTISSSGAYGYTQLTPGTAAEMGVNYKDPAENLLGGAGYLAKLIRDYSGNVDQAILHYGGFSDPASADAQSYLDKIKNGADASASSLFGLKVPTWLHDMFTPQGVTMIGLAVLLTVSGIWVIVNSASKQ